MRYVGILILQLMNATKHKYYENAMMMNYP
jgi:hypothetical protein